MADADKNASISHLAWHSIVYAVGDFIGKGIGFILLPVYTRYLVPAQYGVLELLDLVSYIAGFIVAMGMAQAMSRFYQDARDDSERGEIISAALTAVVGAAVIFLAITAPFISDISLLVFKTDAWSRALRIVFLSLTIGLINEVPLMVIRLEQRSLLYVAISLGRTLVTLLLSIFFVVFQGRGVYGVLFASNISISIFGTALVIWLLRKIRFRFRWDRLRPLLRYGLPLVGSWCGAFILNFADRFFLQRLSSLDAVGIYAVAYKFGMLPNMLVLTPFFMVWSTRQFEIGRRSDSREIFGRLFVYLLFAELFVFLLVSLPIREGLSILVAPEYVSAASYVPVLLLAYVFYAVYSFSQFGLLQLHRTALLSSLVLTCAGVNLLLNYLLIPVYQVWGAALATAISYGLLALIVGLISRKLFIVDYDAGRIAKLLLVAVGLYCIAAILPIGALIPGLIIKVLLAVSFPLWLYPLGFYQTNELSFARDVAGKARKLIAP